MPRPSPFPAPLLMPAATVACLLLAGCAAVDRVLPNKEELPFVYRLDVQQGNVVTQQMLAQLAPGMEKSKVRQVMGTPVLIDVFHSNRWDYLYTFQDGGGPRQRRQVSLFFEDEKLVRVGGDVRPAPGPLVVERKPDVEVQVPEVDRRLIDRMREKVGLGDTSQADRAAKHLLEVEEAERERAERDAKFRARAQDTAARPVENEAEATGDGLSEDGAEDASSDEAEGIASGDGGDQPVDAARPGLFRRMMRDMGFGGASDTVRALSLPEQEL